MDKKLVVKRIDELIIVRKISVYDLKENAELSSTIYQWRKNVRRDANRNPSLTSIEKICKFLGISLSYFFAFDREEQARIKNEELIALIESLNDASRDALIDFIQGMKGTNTSLKMRLII